MYIPYDKIEEYLEEHFNYTKLKEYFYRKKISQNLKYIEKNEKKVISRLRKKYSKGKKINVVFYIYDEAKWKCQSLYELLEDNDKFNVKILVTRNSVVNKENPSWQTKRCLKKTYQFFFEKGMNVEYAYDIEKQEHIPFKKFKPDVVIYQHPWYVETSQGPVVCSKFALTYYVPYYFPTTTAPIDYYLRFHRYIENYCVFDEITKNVYKEKMENKAKNVIVTGQPFLDYFRTHHNKGYKYTIYAPHWSICNQGIAYGTFEWNGKWLLEYAKGHPEMQWVFKPHSLLKKALVDRKVMTEEEVQNYYEDWNSVGIVYEHGDYLDLFNQSKLLITDCSSFLGEYFMTENPVIHLISKNATPYNETINQVIKHYYKAECIEHLAELLSELPTQDYMKEERIKAIEELGYKNNNASQNILNNILEKLS